MSCRFVSTHGTDTFPPPAEIDRIAVYVFDARISHRTHFAFPSQMRTSRISRDTSRILAATQTQRTLRQTRSTANVAAYDAREKDLADRNATANGTGTASDSELSSVPSDLDTDADEPTTTGKRKRGRKTSVVVKREQKEVLAVASTLLHEEDRPPKRRRQPAKKVKTEDGGVKVEPPSNWKEVYALTREMRNENPAPVDTMGCESLAEKDRSPRDQRFQTLIALMLSSQTKDTVNAVAMRNMQDRMPGVSWPTQGGHRETDSGRASISNPSLHSSLLNSMPSSTKSAFTT